MEKITKITEEPLSNSFSIVIIGMKYSKNECMKVGTDTSTKLQALEMNKIQT